MFLREQNEDREYRDLAPYGLKSAESRGRVHPQKEDRFRPVYLRDRDRVIHSAAFRRLEFKTQVFLQNEGDYYRTRLTHTLEVAQIARSVAYSLRLNEGFVEALALAHDLGHPPFGHAGEKILNGLMAEYGGFEHNRQGLRTVDLIERPYPDFPGLNLTFELRASILKHGAEGQAPDLETFIEGGRPLLEAQVVDFADRAAYTHHDLDDGLEAGILDEEKLSEAALWREAAMRVSEAHPTLTERPRRRRIMDSIIKRIIGDLIKNAHENLLTAKPADAEEARHQPGRLIRHSAEMEARCLELSRCLDRNFYKDYRVVRTVVRSERILGDLFRGFLHQPRTLPPFYAAFSETVGLERAICDYLAGMTDRFAEDEWNRLRF